MSRLPVMDDLHELARLAIPASPPFVGVARTVIVAVASTLSDVDDERLEDLRVAVSEACTNAVEAHQSADTDDRILLRCLVSDDRIEVHIEDRGPGFDAPQAMPPQDLRRIEDLTIERGWGIQLIRSLVDEAVFRTAGAGMAVHLVLKRGGF
jgi:serine/threonine-protein kinase RsbW